MVLKEVSCAETGLTCVFDGTEYLEAEILLTSIVIESVKAALQQWIVNRVNKLSQK